MPNALATLALAVWPLVTVFLFLKLPPGRAVIATLLTGYLFLPEPPAGKAPPGGPGPGRPGEPGDGQDPRGG